MDSPAFDALCGRDAVRFPAGDRGVCADIREQNAAPADELRAQAEYAGGRQRKEERIHFR